MRLFLSLPVFIAFLWMFGAIVKTEMPFSAPDKLSPEAAAAGDIPSPAHPRPARQTWLPVPLVVVEDPSNPIQIGRPCVLRQEESAHPVGYYGPLALGGPGADSFLNNLKCGYPGLISPGDVLTTLSGGPGRLKGLVKEGISYRLDQRTDVLIVAVSDTFPNARGEVALKGFAVFHVQAVSDRGELSGIYIKSGIRTLDQAMADFLLLKNCRLRSTCRICNGGLS